MLSLVPYDGDGGGAEPPVRRQGGSALRFPEASSIPFDRWAGWMRGAKRARAVPIGCHEDSCEEKGLLRTREDTEDHVSFVKLMDRSNYRARLTTAMTVIALLAVIGVLLGVGLILVRVSNNLADIEAAIAPRVEEMVDSTMAMMNDARQSLSHFEHAAGEGDAVATQAAPQMASIVNSSRQIAERFQHLLSHPVLQLSLTDVQQPG